MAGTRIGGLKAREKNLAKDPDFYKKIGQRGGQAKVPKGFALDRQLAQRAGRIAGIKSGATRRAKRLAQAEA